MDASLSSEEKLLDLENLRDAIAELDINEYDDAVQEFLREVQGPNPESYILRQAATLLLQDEVDLSPELAELDIEPDEELIMIFIAAGADVNARNAYGNTPLCIAAKNGYEEIVQILLEEGAKKEQRNAQGKLPADLASTPALIAALMPEGSIALGYGDERADGFESGDENVDKLPDFIKDADCAEADEDYFAPGNDCGLGEIPSAPRKN